MNLNDCYSFEDFRKLAKKKLPAPIFHYIDGGSDDETTLKRNTMSFLKCDLVPNILASVGEPDLSTTVFGEKIDLPIFFAPTDVAKILSLGKIGFGSININLLKLKFFIARAHAPMFSDN